MSLDDEEFSRNIKEVLDDEEFSRNIEKVRNL
jgi:hypothetical protein